MKKLLLVFLWFFKDLYAYDGLIPQNQFARQMLSKTYDDKIQDRMTHHPQHG